MADMQARTITLRPLDDRVATVERLADQLSRYLDDLHVELSAEQVRLCVEHLLYVEQVNEYINLTRIVDLDEAVVLHILDSLTLVPYLSDAASSFLDMGTGAGFPGIPLRIAVGGTWTLIDSVAKKINAVNAFVDALSLEHIQAVHDRLESFALDRAGSFDSIVARALAPLPMLLEFASPLVHAGGQLLVSKGNPSDEEMERGERASVLCGFELRNRYSLDLPHGLGHREILDYRKTSRPRVKLPRAVGEAKRHPLG